MRHLLAHAAFSVLQAVLLPCRHYMDAVLIAVVALCTLENDVVHAGYLALALLLFRQREVLRGERSHLFKWLAIYNFGVLALTLAFQAPFEDTWGSIWNPQRQVGAIWLMGLVAGPVLTLLAGAQHWSFQLSVMTGAAWQTCPCKHLGSTMRTTMRSSGV